MTESLPSDVVEALGRPEVSSRLGVFGERLSYRSVVSSTNDVALELVGSGAPEGTAVLASEQTAGRGRRGRWWHSPPGTGLYLSLVLRDVESPLVTLLAGVAVAEGIRAATGVAAELEWPNDIVVESPDSTDGPYPRLKLGGILSESSAGPVRKVAVVVGIGVNLTCTPYPDAIAARASSLEAHARRAVDRGTVLTEILAAVAEWRDRFVTDGGAMMLRRWRELSPSSVGAPVGWTAEDGERRGVTDGVDLDGALRVRSGDRVERLVGGALTWLPDRLPSRAES